MRGLLIGIAALLVVPLQTADAESAWQRRIRKELKRVEAEVKKLDGLKADTQAKIDLRLLTLDQRVAKLETKRKMKVVHAKLGQKGKRVDMTTRSAAVVQIQGRVRRIQKHDNPPVVTEKSKSGKSEKKEEPKPKPDKDAPVVWPEVIEIKATASLDYKCVGEWLYGSTPRSRRYAYEYLHTGYEGELHLSARLSKLERQVKTVELVIVITGRTGPFELSDPVKYEMTWTANASKMGNGAVKRWLHHDQWRQGVRALWIRGPRHKNVKPRAEAYLTRVVTDKGRELEFKPPRKFR